MAQRRLEHCRAYSHPQASALQLADGRASRVNPVSLSRCRMCMCVAAISTSNRSTPCTPTPQKKSTPAARSASEVRCPKAPQTACALPACATVTTTLQLSPLLQLPLLCSQRPASRSRLTAGLDSIAPPTDKDSNGAHAMMAQSSSAMQLDALGHRPRPRGSDPRVRSDGD